MTQPAEVLTAKEVAELARVDVTTVYRWVRLGELEALDLPGSAVRFAAEDVHKRINGRRRRAA